MANTFLIRTTILYIFLITSFCGNSLCWGKKLIEGPISKQNRNLKELSGTNSRLDKNGIKNIKDVGVLLGAKRKAGSLYPGEDLLRTFFPKTRDSSLPNLILYYAKNKEPKFSLIHRGKRTHVLKNEPYIWVFIFSEEPFGEPVTEKKKKKLIRIVEGSIGDQELEQTEGEKYISSSWSPNGKKLAVLLEKEITQKQDDNKSKNSKDSDKKEAKDKTAKGKFEVRLEGLRVEKQKSAVAALAKLVTGIFSNAPADDVLIPLEKDEPVTLELQTIKAVDGEDSKIYFAYAKLELSSNSINRIKVKPLGAKKPLSTTFKMANVRFRRFGAGIGAGGKIWRLRQQTYVYNPGFFLYLHYAIPGLTHPSPLLRKWSVSLIAGIPVKETLTDVAFTEAALGFRIGLPRGLGDSGRIGFIFGRTDLGNWKSLKPFFGVDYSL